MKAKKDLFPDALVLFSVISSIFGLLFILLVPPFWGLDEPAHFNRSYQIAQGVLLPIADKTNYGGKIPENLKALENLAVGDLVTVKSGLFGRRDLMSADTYTKLGSEKFSKVQTQSPATSFYSPFAYLGPIAGVFVAKIFNLSMGNAVFAARAGSLLVYIALVGAALWLLRKSQLRWLFFVIALFPVSLFQATVVTADSILLGVSFCFTALIIRLMTREKREPTDSRLLAASVGLAFILPMIKINYLFLSAALMLVTAKAFSNNILDRSAKILGVGLATGAGLTWIALSKITQPAPNALRPDHIHVDGAAQVSSLLHAPLNFVTELIRTLVQSADAYLLQGTVLVGWNYVALPILFIVLLCAVVLLAAMFAKDENAISDRKLVLWNLFSLVGAASIFAALYVSFTPPEAITIEGVQGRYFLPFLIPAIMLFVRLVPIKVSMQEASQRYLFAGVSCICLFASVIYYFTVTY